MRNNERQFSPPHEHVVSILCLFCPFFPCPSLSLSLTLCFSFSFSSPSTKSWDTLIKISSDRQNMIFAFYPTDRQRCGFWGREINISSRLWQLCMHSRRPHKLESNSSAHEGMVEYAEKGAIASPVSLSFSSLFFSPGAFVSLFVY